ncbi:MAG: hypothetical protein WB789_05740 [Thermoplasmata archaeon]
MDNRVSSKARAGGAVPAPLAMRPLSVAGAARAAALAEGIVPHPQRPPPRAGVNEKPPRSARATGRPAYPRATARRSSLGKILSALALVAAMLLTAVVTVAPSAAVHAAPSTTSPLSVSIHGVAATETPDFWGAFIDGTSAPSAESAALNATPIKYLRFCAAQCDAENWSNGCYYTTNGACSPLQENPLAFMSLCEANPIYYCQLGVPAETNSAKTVAYLLNWLYANDGGFWPSCFAVGNEPGGWGSFNIPWTSSHWDNANYRSNVTAAQFGLVARNLTDTIRHVDPGACVVGLEDGSDDATSWIQSVIADAPNVTSLAVHSYPVKECTGASAAASLTNAYLTNTVSNWRANDVPDAAGKPVYVHEFNVIHVGCSGFDVSNTGAVFVAANIAQALEAGVPDVTYFRFYCGTATTGGNCMYNSGSHYATDVYQLYSGLFTHMDITSIRNVTLSSGVNAETYAAEGSDNATDASLLFTNAATSGWENVSLAGVSPTNWTGEVYSQSTTGTLSRAVYVPGMTVALPPESTVVVKMYHAGSTGGGTKGSSSRTWTVAGTVELTNSTPTANMTVGLDFDLQNGSTIQLDPLVGPAGGFSVGNLTFNGTFASAKLGPGAYTLLRVTENTLVPQGLLFTIYAEITTNDSTGKGNSSTGKGNSSTGSGGGSGPPGAGSGTTTVPTREPVVISVSLEATLIGMTLFALGLSASGAIASARKAGGARVPKPGKTRPVGRARAARR